VYCCVTCPERLKKTKKCPARVDVSTEIRTKQLGLAGLHNPEDHSSVAQTGFGAHSTPYPVGTGAPLFHYLNVKNVNLSLCLSK
jgi:hypothetical protein